MRLLLVVVMSLAACTTTEARFGDRAILWREPDTRPIPLPKENEALANYIGLRDAIYGPADRELALDYGKEAVNANALDEAPDSTWFADPRRVVDERGQIRLRSFSAAELERGAMRDELDPRPPYTITKGKGVGANLGFEVRDALGRKYLFKMDPPGLFALDTSTEVVVTRLAWAAGWYVPKEVLIDFKPGDLRLAPDAYTRDPKLYTKEPLTQAVLDGMLHTVPTSPDGTIRAVASRWIEGTSRGPFAFFGRRKDDPNDRIEHEQRRDLRGFGTFSMWVNNIDALETNTLDSYVGKPGQGWLVHWQQDVGGSFGARAEAPIAWWMGTDIYLAPSRILASLFSLGFYRRPWDPDSEARLKRAQLIARYPELGNFDWERFDPGDWHVVLDNPAFERQTLRDRYWATKLLLAFSEEELRGAIRSGRYRPEAAERLFQVLWKRREKIARAYLDRVAALDYFRFPDGKRMCFDDLWIKAGLGGEERTGYVAGGEGVQAAGAESRERPCVELAPREGYRVVHLQVQRPGERHAGPEVRVHLVEHAGVRRLVGIERDTR